MNNKLTSKGRSQDRSMVAAGQDYEVTYEKDKLNVTGKEIRDVVKSQGNSRKKNRREIKD